MILLITINAYLWGMIMGSEVCFLYVFSIISNVFLSPSTLKATTLITVS